MAEKGKSTTPKSKLTTQTHFVCMARIIHDHEVLPNHHSRNNTTTIETPSLNSQEEFDQVSHSSNDSNSDCTFSSIAQEFPEHEIPSAISNRRFGEEQEIFRLYMNNVEPSQQETPQDEPPINNPPQIQRNQQDQGGNIPAEDDTSVHTESSSMPSLIQRADQDDSSSDESASEFSWSDSSSTTSLDPHDLHFDLDMEEFMQENNNDPPTTHHAQPATLHTANMAHSDDGNIIGDPDEAMIGSPGNINNWLCDTGATAHMTPRLEDLYDTEEVTSTNVAVADGYVVPISISGKCKLELYDQEQNHFNVTLTEVFYVPGLTQRLFSVPKFSLNGNHAHIHNGFITLSFNGKEVQCSILRNSSNFHSASPAMLSKVPSSTTTTTTT